MIPPFDDSGLLPPGLHPAALAEIAGRFGTSSPLRQAQMQSLRGMIALAVRAGVRRIALNGSFVTDLPEPGRVDCVLLVAPGFPIDPTAGRELREGLPFLQASLVDQEVFDYLLNHFFSFDRAQRPKGLIEVAL
jgi:hypothetical protein